MASRRQKEEQQKFTDRLTGQDLVRKAKSRSARHREINAMTPEQIADRMLGAMRANKKAPTRSAYERITEGDGVTLQDQYRLDDTRLQDATGVLRDQATRPLDELSESNLLQQRLLEHRGARATDASAREAATGMGQLRQKLMGGGAGELAAIRGAQFQEQQRMQPFKQLQGQQMNLTSNQMQSRMGDLQRQVGLDVNALRPEQTNISRSLNERKREDDRILDQWSQLKKAKAGASNAKAIRESGNNSMFHF